MAEIIAIFTKEEEKNKIIEKFRKYSFEELEKHPHLEFSFMEKLTDINKIKQNYPKFELIKSVELRENEKKQKYYSLNYELADGTFMVLVFSFEKEKPVLINGFHANRNYKKFESSLRKNYSNKII